jgi:hypothetical protein
MDIANEDVSEVSVEIPEGHRHVRTRVLLIDGAELVFREATIASIARAYLTVKTDPQKSSVKLVGRRLAERKAGYAEWQLLEAE